MASSSRDENIDFSGAYAVAEWHCSQYDVLRRLVHPDPSCNITCAIRLDVGSKSASFKLRFPVTLKAQRTKTSVFLSIPPAQILSLTSSGNGPVPQVVRAKLNTHVTSLSFKLSKAPLVIAPSIPLTPKNKKSGDVLEAVESLASSTAFIIYIPSRYIPKNRRDLLCRLVNDETNLNTYPKEADLSSLYGGNAARSFEGGEFKFAAPTSAAENHPAESPPSYDELAPTPPPIPPFPEKESHVDTEKSSKRRRIEEPNASGATESDAVDEERMHRIFSSLFKQQESWLRAVISTQTQQAMNAQIEALEAALTASITARVNASINARMAEIQKDLCSQMSAINAQMQKLNLELEGIDERLDELPDELLDQAESSMEIKLDDRMFDIKDELADCIKEELKDVEDRIKNEISGASISLQFD